MFGYRRVTGGFRQATPFSKPPGWRASHQWDTREEWDAREGGGGTESSTFGSHGFLDRGLCEVENHHEIIGNDMVNGSSPSI